MYKLVGVNHSSIESNVFSSAIQEAVKSATAKYTAEELITKRELVRNEIEGILKDKTKNYGLLISQVNIVNFEFSDSFDASIESKVRAEQDALTQRNKLEQVKYEAQQQIERAKAEAETIRISAEAIQNRFAKLWHERDGMSQLTDHVTEKIEKDWWKALVRDVFLPFGEFAHFENFFDKLYERFGHPEVWNLYPGAREVLSGLRAQGKRLAVISNWDSRLMRLMDQLDIRGYFEFILASAVFGSSKPGSRIFEEALRRMAVSPHDAIHVGDSLDDDVRGARRAGIGAVLIDRHHRFQHHELAQESCHLIRDLSELM
jgi:putative hydrolase of the HAD superfamily